MNEKLSNAKGLGMSCPISRRDFVNGVLVGSGAGLLLKDAPATAMESPVDANAPSGSAWTGYGGVGDYRWSNGNTEAVRDAGHGIRDRLYVDVSSVPVEETHDLVIIGGGFSGVSALYEFSKHRTSAQTALLLENHPVPGGEAKQNEFEVEGRRLTAPQGSNGALVIKAEYRKGSYGEGRYDTYADYWRELNLPEHFELEPLAGGAEKYNLSNDHFDPLFLEQRFATGYYFPNHGWMRNPLETRFRQTPWSPTAQKDLDDFAHNRRDVISGIKEPDAWLDSISYYDLLDKLGYGSEVRQYVDPVIGTSNFGVCGNAISAYAAKRLTLPGTVPSAEKNRFDAIDVVSFPGGNAVILRAMLKRMLPDALDSNDTWSSIAQGTFNFAAFDQPGNPLRIRLSSTVVRVEHDGNPQSAGSVLVTYLRDGKLHKVRAKAAILGAGGWINRHIVNDLPEHLSQAYGQFRYGPILTANVAVRHWRFFDKLGITVARWFSGLGSWVCVRRNVASSDSSVPLTPDSPIVLTFYISFLHPDADPTVQGALGRAQLLSTSYAGFEHQLRMQMSEMFGSAGFNAKKDIAGIVLNRWGHAYFAPPVGFFFGSPGRPAPHEVLRRPYGRIMFAHSELQGNMNMAHAMLEGRRGALQAFDVL